MIGNRCGVTKCSANPKVSIIIPIYRREQYLSECFHSALWQTLQEIEVIIVDKGEDDDAKMLIDEIKRNDPRVIAPHVKNNGYGASCNIGLDIARGEYILILESDDYIEPDACEKLYEFAKKMDADIVKTPYMEMYNDGRFQDCPHREKMATLLPVGKCFSTKEFGELLEIHASIWSCLYKREYLLENQVRFVEADGAGYVDVGFRIDTLIHTDKIAWLDDPFYNYRVDSSGSSTNIWNISTMNQRWKEVHEKFVEDQEDYDNLYGPHLLADEYINTVYRGELAPLSEKEKREIEYNLSFIKQTTIQRARRLTPEQKNKLIRIKHSSAIQIKNGRKGAQQDLPDLKIFVSFHSENNVVIDNPVYIPILSGAVFNATDATTMLRDDTGDNISAKNKSFCELTAQYWAWKNIVADYYGLCHYRRYIDFSGEKWGIVDDHGQMGEAQFLTMEVAKKYGLTDGDAIRRYVKNYDAIIIKTADVRRIPTPTGFHDNIYDFWTKGCINLLEPNSVDKMLDLILNLHPEYYEAAVDYLNQNRHRGYNTFILRKELYFRLCQFEFDILFEIEKLLTPENHSKLMHRMMGYLAEILSGIFFYVLEHDKKYRVAVKQLVLFDNCTKPERHFLKPAFEEHNVPIVFMSSRSNIPYLSVCLQSLKAVLSSEWCYDIIIVETDFDRESKSKLSKIFQEINNARLRFYDPFQMIERQNFPIKIEAYSALPYYKPFLPWILPLYSQAVVLDTDIVIKKDPAVLLQLDWGDACIAGVKDIVAMGMVNGVEAGWREYMSDTLGLSDPYSYINAGVLSMNLENVRKSMAAEKIIAIARRPDIKLADQDVINMAYQGRVHFLDSKWNLFVKTNWWVSSGIEAAPRKCVSAYEEAESDPSIIHYANKPKPWQDSNIAFSEDWWEMARKSPYYESIFVAYLRQAQPIREMAISQAIPEAPDNRSGARRLADRILPKGTRRREIAKKMLPKGSLRWKFCKQIYYIFHPEYRAENKER